MKIVIFQQTSGKVVTFHIACLEVTALTPLARSSLPNWLFLVLLSFNGGSYEVDIASSRPPVNECNVISTSNGETQFSHVSAQDKGTSIMKREPNKEWFINKNFK